MADEGRINRPCVKQGGHGITGAMLRGTGGTTGAIVGAIIAVNAR